MSESPTRRPMLLPAPSSMLATEPGPGSTAEGTTPMPAIGGAPGSGVPSSAHDTARDAFPPSFGPATAGHRSESRADGRPDARGRTAAEPIRQPVDAADATAPRRDGQRPGDALGATGPHSASVPSASARPVLGAATEILLAANVVAASTSLGAVAPMTPGRDSAPRSPLAATLPMDEPTSLRAERRSSASPVEKSVGWPSRSPRVPPVVAFGSLLLALGLLVGWLLERAPTEGAAPVAASGPASARASASVPPASSAAAPTSGSAAVAPQASARHAPTLPRSGDPRP